MRIAVVTTSFPAHAEDPSGHFVQAELAALIEAGHEVTLLLPRANLSELRRSSEPLPSSDSCGPNLTVRELPHGGLFGWPGCLARLRERPWRLLGLLPFQFRARQQLRALGPFDQIIAHWIVPGFWPICRDHVAKTVVVAHGSDVRLVERLPRWLQSCIVTTLARSNVTLRCVSTELAERMQRLARRSARQLAVLVEPPLLRIPTLPPASELREQLGFSAAPVVVIVGRAVESKRIDVAVEAVLGATRVAALEAAPEILVIGDGPERQAWMRRFPTARWLGQLARYDTLRHIRAADLLVSASLLEGAPTAIREARHLGTPVVAAEAGDLANWSERDAGLCVLEHFTSEPGGDACQVIARSLRRAAAARTITPRESTAS